MRSSFFFPMMRQRLHARYSFVWIWVGCPGAYTFSAPYLRPTDIPDFFLGAVTLSLLLESRVPALGQALSLFLWSTHALHSLNLLFTYCRRSAFAQWFSFLSFFSVSTLAYSVGPPLFFTRMLVFNPFRPHTVVLSLVDIMFSMIFRFRLAANIMIRLPPACASAKFLMTSDLSVLSHLHRGVLLSFGFLFLWLPPPFL